MGPSLPVPVGLGRNGWRCLLQACNKTPTLPIFRGVFFAKPAGLWFNSPNFLNKEVGPGF